MLSANDLTLDQKKKLVDMDAGGDICMGCHKFLPVGVCVSAAGFYVGTVCENCGPYDRKSMYSKSEEEVEHWLMTACWPIRA